MYHGKRISVAMATYNGERFLSEQLDSILQQAVVPDEIIISDDGSSDQTLAIARQYEIKWKDQLTITVLSDNPRHGIGGNFEWAISHTTGDYVFVCGQDDVWDTEKVSHVIGVFELYPDAELVCHNIYKIDENNRLLSENVEIHFNYSRLPGAVTKVDRDKYLETALSLPLVSGNAVCISSKLRSKCLPIPIDWTEDQWLETCAIIDDEFLFLNEALTGYRIHNSTTHSVGLKLTPRMKKCWNRIRNAFCDVRDLVRFADAAEEYALKVKCDEDEILLSLYRVTNRLREIGKKQIEAAESNRAKGMGILIGLYKNDMRYRRMGSKAFLMQLLNVMLYSKRKRQNWLNTTNEGNA